jgi:hypothetical protein
MGVVLTSNAVPLSIDNSIFEFPGQIDAKYETQALAFPLPELTGRLSRIKERNPGQPPF